MRLLAAVVICRVRRAHQASVAAPMLVLELVRAAHPTKPALHLSADA